MLDIFKFQLSVNNMILIFVAVTFCFLPNRLLLILGGEKHFSPCVNNIKPTFTKVVEKEGQLERGWQRETWSGFMKILVEN